RSSTHVSNTRQRSSPEKQHENEVTKEKSSSEGSKETRRCQSDRLRPTHWRRLRGRPTPGLQRSHWNGSQHAPSSLEELTKECGWRRGPRRRSCSDRSARRTPQKQGWPPRRPLTDWAFSWRVGKVNNKSS